MSKKKINSRTKGHSFEREVAKKFRDDLGMSEAKRGFQCRSGDDDADVITDDGMWHECKRYAKGNVITKAMEQAIKASNGKIPVVHFRCDRGEHLITFRWEDWVEMLPNAVHISVAK